MSRPQRAIDVQQAIGQTLEEMRLVPVIPEMVQLDLACVHASALARSNVAG